MSSALVLLLFGPLTSGELCFEVAWGSGAGAQRQIVRPVDGFPAGHTLTEATVCGQTFAAGE